MDRFPKFNAALIVSPAFARKLKNHVKEQRENKMAEKHKFTVIIRCAICRKDGVGLIRQDQTVETMLQASNETGFKYGPIGGGDWRVACHECFDKSKAIIDKQKLDRENFLKGE